MIDNAVFTASNLGIISQAGLTLGPHLTIDYLSGNSGLSLQGDIRNEGTIAIDPGNGSIVLMQRATVTTFTNDGIIDVRQGSFLDDQVRLDGDGTVEAFGNTHVNFDGSVGPNQNLQLIGNGNSVVVETPVDFHATLGGFTAGNTVYFSGLTIDFAIYVPGSLIFYDAGVQVQTLSVADDLSDASFTFTPNAYAGTNVSIACFAAGTRIETERGTVAMEDLCEGDLVLTATGALRPIRWIGRRRVDCRRHSEPHHVWPVRIAAGAFGNGLPTRDLFLSPDHAVFVDDVLIPVKHLLVGSVVAQVPIAGISYFHIELDRHDILLAEGLSVESLLPGSDRSGFQNGGCPLVLHPDFYSRQWDAEGCAPLIVTGPVVAAVRARLASRCTTTCAEQAAAPDKPDRCIPMAGMA